jgi:TusA-related sulfurtransferase
MTTSSHSASPPIESSPGDIDLVIDLTGEVCPFTFVRTKLALEALPLGAALRVIVDHAPAAANVPRSARAWGQEVAAVRQVGGVWHIDLVKRVR